MTIPLEPVAARARSVSSWFAWTIAGGAAASAAIVLAAGAPDGPDCVLRHVAHVSCPTCGLTRAITALLRGDLVGSIAIHPWGVALVVQVAAAWIAWGLWNARASRERPDRFVPRIVAVNAGMLALIWIVRFATDTLP